MRKDLPTGVVTFMFTDIEGSTRLVRELGDRYGDVLADQRRILREVWQDWRGVERSTEGDSFFIVFRSPTDAVGAAAEAQRRLAAHERPHGCRVLVRMGMHTGATLVVDDDYFGIDVNRAARIAGTSHGGQVVLSRATHDLLDPPPAGISLRDLGEHRLKDLEQPEWLYQLVGEGLPDGFPPLRSLEVPTNLPTPATALIGRAAELAELEGLLEQDGTRLVTLTGPGGAGKTRLAIEAAARVRERFANGVFFVPLAAVADPADVLPSIAHVLGVEIGSRRVEERLAEDLRVRSLLLVLDNFEHVARAAPGIAALITAAPRLKVLATSRAVAADRRRTRVRRWALGNVGRNGRSRGDRRITGRGAFLRASAFGEAVLARDGGGHGCRGRDLPQARRASAGDRTGRRQDEDPCPPPDPPTAGKPFDASQGWCARPAGTSANAARHDRVERRPPRARGSVPVSALRRLLGRGNHRCAGGRALRRGRGSARCARRTRRPQPHHRERGGREAIRDAADDPRVRARSLRAPTTRRNSGAHTPRTSPVSRKWPTRSSAERRRASGGLASKPSSPISGLRSHGVSRTLRRANGPSSARGSPGRSAGPGTRTRMRSRVSLAGSRPEEGSARRRRASCSGLVELGVLHDQRGDFEPAARLFESALEAYRELGDSMGCGGHAQQPRSGRANRRGQSAGARVFQGKP